MPAADAVRMREQANRLKGSEEKAGHTVTTWGELVDLLKQFAWQNERMLEHRRQQEQMLQLHGQQLLLQSVSIANRRLPAMELWRLQATQAGDGQSRRDETGRARSWQARGIPGAGWMAEEACEGGGQGDHGEETQSQGDPASGGHTDFFMISQSQIQRLLLQEQA
eukprot:766857-Hanusia_phi.AAC.3